MAIVASRTAIIAIGVNDCRVLPNAGTAGA
jgi:hypothetical protein